jgi:hypothetical protein
MAERRQRIAASGTPGGQTRGDDCRGEDYGRDRAERPRIACVHVEEQRRHCRADRRHDRRAARDRQHRERRRLAAEHRHNRARRSAERDADRRLARAQRGDVRDDAVDAERREQQREGAGFPGNDVARRA